MMNSIYRWVVVLLGVAIAMLAFVFGTQAQSLDGLLYGKVYTRSGSTYTGVIRWGSEEALWSDLFNAGKVTDRYSKMVPEKQSDNESWFNIDWSLGSIWEDKIVAHQFNTQFGNLSQITRLSDRRARLKFRNGSEMEISGDGYNDLSSTIHVADHELGTISFDWEKIDRIEFMETPSRPAATFGTPLYGTVEGVRKESFTGFIAWDNDERLTADKLDGDNNDGDQSFKFGEIASIEKEGRGSRVKLKSGREYFLTGSNDVNSENRGVLVSVEDVGVVQVSWDAFRKVTFTSPPKSGISFDKFSKPKLLQGTVSRLDGDDLTGRIIYDIDEILDFEIIEGDENNIMYHFPIRNIKTIAPKNFDYASITLRNGQTLLVGGRQDVSARNGGVLVFVKGKKEPEYVRWKNINEIEFD